MKIDNNGDLIPENYDSKFYYGGTYFVVDNHHNGWRISERNHMISEFGNNFQELKNKIKNKWDIVLENKLV